MNALAQPVRTWSPLQTNIFNFVEFGQGNAIIMAVAGSGKTTTIVEAIKKALGTAVFLAFNKVIADELKGRGVNACTFHSLCFSAVMRHLKANKVESNKLRKLIDTNMSGNDAILYGSFITKLVSLAKQSGIGCLVNDEEAEWMAIVEHHDMELDAEKATMPEAINFARKLLQWSNNSPMIDFDDMLYIAVKDGLTLPKYDFIFVDEAQDTNAIQRAILRKVMKPASRLIAVGDPAQAIYGFRGADSSSMDLIAKEFNCTKLPLSVSYRCASDIVNYARQWVNHIESAPGAVKGEIVHLNDKWDVKSFVPNDLVVCRTTQPLIALGYKMLKARVPVRILGREIGQGLINHVEKMRAKGIDNLINKLGVWRNREVEKAIAKKQEDKVEAIHDKTDAILCLIDGLAETERTVPALLEVIRTLFSDVKNATVLATIHKAKGLEADTVYWLNSSKCPAKWARQPWQQEQEINLCYVAATRAKLKLILIEDKKDDEKA